MTQSTCMRLDTPLALVARAAEKKWRYREFAPATLTKRANPMSTGKRIPVWDGAEYAHVLPGRYTAACVRLQGPDWVNRYRRWSLMVEFELLGEAESVRVCAFFNMGNDPASPKVGRQSRYFRAWTLANGEAPLKGQKMLPEVFREGQIFEIQVNDNRKDSESNPKADCEVYSFVSNILSVIRPNR